jgi:hypothetical protein
MQIIILGWNEEFPKNAPYKFQDNTKKKMADKNVYWMKSKNQTI